MKKIIIIVTIIVFICGGIGAMFFINRNRTSNLTQYVEEMSGAKIGEYVIAEAGKVKYSWGDEHSYIRLQVDKERIDEFYNVLNKVSEPYEDKDEFVVPGYSGNEFAKEIKDGEIDNMYFLFLKGKSAKTRSVEIYVVKTAAGDYYMYFMG